MLLTTCVRARTQQNDGGTRRHRDTQVRGRLYNEFLSVVAPGPD